MVTPRKSTNAKVQTLVDLTRDDVGQLIDAAKSNRYGRRDALMILMAFRHGLRAAEVCNLRWNQIDFIDATLNVRRVNKGTPATHKIRGDELRALRRHIGQCLTSEFLFVSERGAPLAPPGFLSMLQRTAEKAGLCLKVRAPMLRHACGYALASAGYNIRAIQAYLGHRNIMNTARYTAPAKLAHGTIKAASD
jgi:integrase